jgi:hypothetical protein
MLSRRTRGELELPHQHQAQLRREATRWRLARRAATPTGHRTARPDRLPAALTLGAILVGVAVSVSQTAWR